MKERINKKIDAYPFEIYILFPEGQNDLFVKDIDFIIKKLNNIKGKNEKGIIRI